jgi:hypothetical protein
MSETDIDPDTLAAALEQLEPGTRIGDKFILSKRQLLAAAGGALSAGALISMGIDEAEAQSAAGQVGTSSEPVDMFGYDVEATNTFTDPSGTSHSGELADASDVGSGASSTSTASGYELTVGGRASAPDDAVITG